MLVRKLMVAILLSSTACIMAMDQVNKEDRDELKNRIVQIDGAFRLGPSWFMGSGQTMNGYISSQVRIIENILDKNSINHPKEKTRGWLEELSNSLNVLDKDTKPKNTAPVYQNTRCDISGLPKEDVILALFKAANSATYYGSKNELNERDMQEALKNLRDIDYLGGRSMKVDLSDDSFDTYLYNRDNGSFAAENAIKLLKDQIEK